MLILLQNVYYILITTMIPLLKIPALVVIVSTFSFFLSMFIQNSMVSSTNMDEVRLVGLS